MRGEGGEQEDELLHRGFGTDFGFQEEVDEFHHPRDGRVEGELLQVVGDGFNRFVQHAVLLGGGLDGLDRGVQLHRLGPIVDDHSPGAIEEAADAANAVHAPGLDRL